MNIQTQSPNAPKRINSQQCRDKHYQGGTAATRRVSPCRVSGAEGCTEWYSLEP